MSRQLRKVEAVVVHDFGESRSENTSAARSRIVDADFAVETSQLARQQILQNAATAMVAQANAIPQQVMALLNGL